jgi:uncharacterized membrane protein YozB (DUF420 family)
MFVLDQRLPVVFRLHMLSSAFALLLVPIVIGFRRHPSVHRKLGRVLGLFVIIGALTALPVAVMSHSSFAARAGFFVQGLVWLALLTSGLMAIRRRDRGTHARFMVAMAAVTTGAIWFRLMTGTAIMLELPFEASYAVASWLGWIIPLAIVTRWPALVPALWE